MKSQGVGSQLWWLIHKDLVVEYRARQAWPAMVLLGILVAVLFSLQLDVPPAQRPAAVGTMLWLATLLAGLVAIERTGSAEQQDGCWDGLLLFPASPTTLFLSKLIVNSLAMLLLQAIMIPLFMVLTDVPLLGKPIALGLIALLGSLGIASVGTLVSAVTQHVGQRGAVLSLLALPLLVPLLLSASEATRLIAENDLGPTWWRWVQFLAGFTVVFVTLGIVLFEYVIEQ